MAWAALCSPLVLQLQLGNFNCLLAALIGIGWVAERRGYTGLAGTILGIAAAVKLFPAFLGLYFLANRRWRGVVGMALGWLIVNAVALTLFGGEACRDYAFEILPTVEAENLSSCLNASVAGFWMRLFAPTASHGILPLVEAPEVGRALTILSQLTILAISAFAASGSQTREDRDRGFAIVCIAMLLIGPLTWSHAFLVLAVPIGLLLARTPPGTWRKLLIACLVILWIPANYPAQIMLSREQASLMLSDRHAPLSPAQNLRANSLATRALLGLFILAVRIARRAK